jgi:hypothetical protein
MGRYASEENPMSIQWRDLTGTLTKRYSLVRNQNENSAPDSGDQNETSKLQQRVAFETGRHEECITRERHAAAKISRFHRGITGAGISLSQPSKPSDPKHGAEHASLSERRDTQEER